MNALPPESGAELEQAVAEVKRLREETEQKATELDRALGRLRALTARQPAPEDEQPRRSAAPRAHAGGADHDDLSEEAMLVATEMAVSGSDRDEIETALRERFGTDDPGPIVDEILGVSSGG